jgi:hypothetical protein
MNSANYPYKLGLMTFSTLSASMVSVAVVVFWALPIAAKESSSNNASQIPRTTPRQLLLKVSLRAHWDVKT